MFAPAATVTFLLFITMTVQEPSSCSNIYLEPLQGLNNCVVQNKTLTLQRHLLVACDGDVYVTLHLIVLFEVPSLSNENNITYCTSLYKLEGRRDIKSWFLTFDTRKAIGIVRTDKSEQNDGSNSTLILDIQLLSSVWSIPALHNDPESDKFWNFSVVDEWILAVGVSECQVRYKWLVALQNTSVSTLSIYRGDPRPTELLLPLLPKITRLIVTRCGLIHFNTSNFAAVPNVEELVLSSNTFPGIPEGISQLKKLKYLDISRNLANTFSIPTEEIQELKQLEYLDLGHNYAINNFKILTQLSYLPNLKVLNLSSCRLPNPREDDEDPFRNFPSLEVLDLSRNKLVRWNPTFLSKKQLKLLDLTRNKFTDFPVIKCCYIAVLSLSFNILRRLDNICKYGTYVEYLDVSLNNISEWKNRELFSCLKVHKFSRSYPREMSLPSSKESIGNLHYNNSFCKRHPRELRESWVHHIDLSGNNIHAVPQEMIDSLSPIRTLDLEGNPFDCTNCSMPNFVEWMHASNKVNSSDRLVCKSPHTSPEEKVTSSKSYEEICFPQDLSTAVLALGHILAICLLIILLMLATGYWYRTEISYTLHLFKIRNARHGDKYDSYTYDAFICYSGRDRAWVMRTLVPSLENSSEKYRLCLHDRDFSLGSMIVDNIVHCIDKSRRVIIVLSQHFVKSKWCQWELDMANHKSFEDSSCFLILIQLEILDRRALPRHLKLLMDTRTYLEWPAKQEAQTNTDVVFKRLKDAMGPSLRQVEHNIATISIEASA